MTETIYHNFETLRRLSSLPRWVAYTGEPLKDGKIDKAPTNPATGHHASNNNPSTWAIRKQAEDRARKLRVRNGRPGIGIVLGPLDDHIALCGIDFDGCLAEGVLEPWADEIRIRLASYTEVSPSGSGAKTFFLVRIADLAPLQKVIGGEHRKAWKRDESHYGFELHLSNSYFTVTDEEYGADPIIAKVVGADDTLRLVPVADLLWIAKRGRAFAGDSQREGKRTAEVKSGRPFHVIRDALMTIPNDGSIPDNASRDWWLQNGMALHFESDGSDEGRAAFHEWSGLWPGYDPDATDKAWNSFGRKTGRLHTGHHILRQAEKYGWRDVERDRIFAIFDAEVEPVEDDDDIAGYDLDEDGVIRAFTDKYQSELRFDHHAGRWFRFNGNYWQREETKLAQHYARQASIGLVARNAKAKHLKKVSVWEAIERGARAVRAFAVTSEVWDRDKLLLGTPGGVVDLRTGKLRKSVPVDHISRVTAAAPIRLDQFEPERDCPRWLAFLNEALAADKGAIRFLQQWGGYSLTGETKEQKLVFVYGPGGSGKGTAINTIGDILGDYAVNVGMETLTASKHERHTTELARLRGARMARASETEKGKAWAENRIKNLTGQDTITARFMRQDDFEFMPEFKLTIFGNNRPSLRDVDSAIKRRFLILPFDHLPIICDPELPEKLRAEWSGILSWLIMGCLDWQANGLAIPTVMDAATQAYFDAEDTFAQWLTDCCETGPEFADTSDNLWQSWSHYAYGLGEDPGTKKGTFAETLSQRGFRSAEKVGRERKRGYKGLQVRSHGKTGDEFPI